MRKPHRSVTLNIGIASLALAAVTLAAGCGAATTTGEPAAGAEATSAPTATTAAADTLTGPPPPTVMLKIVNPARKTTVVRQAKVTIRVLATDGAKVTINGKPTSVRHGFHALTVSLTRGKNEFAVLAKKTGYYPATVTLVVRRKLSAAEAAAQAARKRDAFVAAVCLDTTDTRTC